MKTSEFIKYEIPEGVKSSELKGNNQKKILVVVNTNLDQLLSEQDHLLAKILTAIKIDFPEDIHLLSLTAGKNISLTSLINSGEVQSILMFGITPSQISFQITLPKYQPIQLQGIKLLCADSLEEIEKTQTLKKNLWTCLQHLYLEK